jgi:peroxiredoxin
MKTRILFVSFCLLFILSACYRSPKLKINGNISGAEGKMLYFELFGINKTEVLDSVKLDERGSFHFSTKLPGVPEFYRLRIDGKIIQLGADTSANIVIKANSKHLWNDYSVEGSRSCKLIRILSISQAKALVSIDSLSVLYKNKQLTDTAFQKKIEYILDIHRNLAKKAIFENFRSPAAYFALFQRLNGYLIFNPYDKYDNKIFSAVANSWNTFYPKSNRTKNLVTLTLQGIKMIRENRDKKEIIVHEQDKSTYFEIKLPNIYGKIIPLSSLKGKVVLLDFTAYQTKSSPSRNLSFREFYKKYSRQGFEIYQVSFDSDENFWKTGAANLPWVCVHDKNNLNSEYIKTFNLQDLPTYFLFDRKGNIVARDAMISDLNKEITKLL